VADEKLLSLLKEGVAAWNARRPQPDFSEQDHRLDLIGADLRGANLRGADLRGADLRGACLSDAQLSQVKLGEADLSEAFLHGTDLRGADLRGVDLSDARLSQVKLGEADLSEANLRGANLSGADLSHTDLFDANLRYAYLGGANLSGANLAMAHLLGANLTEANLTEAHLNETLFAGTNLTSVVGLETCTHGGPSIIDFRTLQASPSLPLAFLRGVGLPDTVIDYLRSLTGQPIQFYSCFISYSHRDEEFAQQLHADLQNKGVRCWYAPHDLPIGGKILDEIDAAIRLRDKVLLILSEQSIRSDWVEDEVKTAFEEERKRRQTVLFPLRLDNAIMETKEAWASKLRADRHIGDFRQWKSPDQYQRTLDRVMRDLRSERKST
jgi:uncharacterized protein YjbI with pentapeptide repeats